MSYAETIWSSGDIITQSKISNLEKQYKEAVKLSLSAVFGGGDQASFMNNTAYPSGSTHDKLLPNTTTWRIDPTDLSGGTFQLEITIKANNSSGLATIAVFNTTDAPDTAMTGSTVNGTGLTTGERLRSSDITFPAGGSVKSFGLKGKINSSSFSFSAWAPRIIRVS